MEVVEPFRYVAGDERKRLIAEACQRFPEGVEGKEVPLMREGTWLNTSARSLSDFRGKYVLLDFWFIGCGPCQREIPSLRMAHRQLADLGFTVVSVHTDGQSPKDVQNFADKFGMDYPIVVDDAEGTITKQFRKRGVEAFPSYIFLDPQGRILHNDATSDGLTLREYKMELINQAIRSASN